MASSMGYEAAYVVIEGPGHQGTKVALREGITSLGRLPSNDVVLLGDLVSRHHARIIFFDGRASLQDLGAHNGSWVNGERVTTRALNDGDSLRVGNFFLAFHVGPLPPGEQVTDQVPIQESIPPAAAASGDETADSHSQIDFDGSPVTGSESQVPDHLRRAALRAAKPEVKDPSLPPNPPVNQAGAIQVPDDVPGNVTARQSGARLLEDLKSPEDAPASTLVLLYRVTEALARATDVTDYLEQVMTFTLERITSEVAVFFRILPDQDEPVRVVSSASGDTSADDAVSMSVVRWAIAKSYTVYSQDLKADLRFRHGRSVMGLGEDVRAIVCVPINGQDRVLGALYLTRSASHPYDEAEVDAIEAIAHLCAAGIERIELRQRAMDEGLAREALARFHSPDVVERILREAKNREGPRRYLEGRNATVCFCDIPGFTTIAERLSVEEVSDFLSSYLSQMSSIIFAQRGTIHKLLGDGIVAVFGAPFSYGNDAARAVNAALDMTVAFDRLIAARPKIGARRLRFGINTGWLLTGTIGSPRRMDYAVLGETVNIAGRIQASAAAGAILISEATHALIADAFATHKLGLQQLRGKGEPLQIFEVTGRR